MKKLRNCAKPFYDKTVCGLPVLGIASVIGGFLLQFTMGTFYSFGNIMTYLVSYMRVHGAASQQNLTQSDFVIVQSTWGMTQGVVMPLSGFLIEFIGPKASMTLGASIFSAGCALTYITINRELWMVAATYGFVAAFGQNIALIPTLTTAMRWFPNRRGTVMGIVVGGFGGGALVFNQIQTAIVNPDNISARNCIADECYFTDSDLLGRVPGLLLTLAAIYFVMGMTGALLIVQPPEDWTTRMAIKKRETRQANPGSNDDSSIGVDAAAPANDGLSMTTSSSKTSCSNLEEESNTSPPNKNQAPIFVSWRKAFRRKELYLLWVTRLSVVLITQVIANIYKTFGQTFIFDDHFLATVGSAASFFNCSGRLLYGLIMDKTSYKVGMSIEAIFLTLLMSTFYLTSLVGTSDTAVPSALDTTVPLAASNLGNLTTLDLLTGADSTTLPAASTPIVTKAVYAIWVWCIFLTFPGTYSMQPAVTSQTFGHRHAGTIYAFLFSSDIINNLMVAALQKYLRETYGYLGLFLIVSIWGLVALTATLFYPRNPGPEKGRHSVDKSSLPSFEAPPNVCSPRHTTPLNRESLDFSKV